ncbi:MAG TPA: polysaccharide deacetylase family protein [Terriglobales bacterium]|nr:polysaccharide deacetylase family protein [Terriglobales bacterium]
MRGGLSRAALLLAAIVSYGHGAGGASLTVDRLLLLVPDDVSLTGPNVELWSDAASEEGLHLVAMHDSEFVRPVFARTAAAGVILPDAIHQKTSDAFVAAIHQFVAGGGKLMLVYDAAALSLEGRYALGRSRLSDLAGVNYCLYDALREKTIQWSGVGGDTAAVRELDIPPGKYYPIDDRSMAKPQASSGGGVPEVRLRSYNYGDLKYPSFVTSGNYSGKVLLRSDAGIVAGEHAYEKGTVLFVNLPLAYLKGNTDGLMLHVFLKYFAEHMLALPYLMPVPDGIGGLVLNWHIDSNAAIGPLVDLRSWRPLQEQGPYSIHATAGPDDTAFGDHRGFDIEHNRLSQELIRQFAQQGSQVGSHGGWLHDYFSSHVDSGNPKDLEPLLLWNKTALEQVTGKPVVEYSAPSGNQPPWVTEWLESHGFLAYYYTGNMGMGPTQGYRNGLREGQHLWSFPILQLDRAASFEEMKAEGYSSQEILNWLKAVAEFAVDRRTVRLVYFHPPGILPYKKVVFRWLEATGRLRKAGRFRWYTMAALATFLNARKQVDWEVSPEGRSLKLTAAHPQDLEHQAWWFPAAKFSQLQVVHGSATVVREEGGWRVVAGSGKQLELQAELVR